MSNEEQALTFTTSEDRSKTELMNFPIGNSKLLKCKLVYYKIQHII
jgi:hypothetical protein